MRSLSLIENSVYRLTGNAGTLAYKTDVTGDQLTIEVAQGADGQEYYIPCICDGLQHNIELSEIFDALGIRMAPPATSFFDYMDGILMSDSIPLISIFFDDLPPISVQGIYPVSGKVNPDGISLPDIEDFLTEGVLTQNSQFRETYPDAIEYLRVIGRGTNIECRIKIFHKNSTSQTLILTDQTQESPGVLTFSVGLKSIKELASYQDLGPVKCWDISIKVTNAQSVTTSYPPCRFILKEKRHAVQQFLFQNDLGGLDSIWAEGGIKKTPEYSPTSFTNSGNTNTLKSGQLMRMKADSGPIDSRLRKELWLAFLRATKRYIVGDDGSGNTELTPIHVTDSNPEISTNELDAISFEFQTQREQYGNIPEQQAVLPIPATDVQ